MTLPIQPLCGATDNNKDSTALPLRGGAAIAARRARACLSAAWADPPTVVPAPGHTRREQRKAICYSWSVGYGTLTEEESPIKHDPILQSKKGKVADHTALLEPRGRRLANVNSSSTSFSAPTAHAPSPPLASPPTSGQQQQHQQRSSFFSMPGLKTLVSRRRNSGVSLEGVDTPLVAKYNGTSGGGGGGTPIIRPAASMASLRKYETILATAPPLKPINRLRNTSETKLCSRCSSILTLASTSRYSLSSSTGAFVQVNQDDDDNEEDDRQTRWSKCKLCMEDVPHKAMFLIGDCKCDFCAECMRQYVKCEIGEGAYDISCPDAQCPSKGMLNQEEIERLVGSELYAKHRRYRLNREIELDKSRLWCPRAGCETVCNVCPTQQCNPQSVHCSSCTTDFCSNCKLEWHEGISCDANNKRLKREGKVDEPGIPFDSDLIKCCPMCKVPIEKDEGCAQMMCKRCKHVFCWYCLASLDDDFLLRHYDKGPCKNKLGHSRASVIWHRTQVIGIFAGVGILLLVASPLLLLAAPCIVCCKCRVCNANTTKLDNEDVDET